MGLTGNRMIVSPDEHTAIGNRQLDEREENPLGAGSDHGRTEVDFHYQKVPPSEYGRGKRDDEQVVPIE